MMLVSRIKQSKKKRKNVLLDQMIFLAGNQLSLPQRLPLGIPEASAKEREVTRVNKEDPTK